MKNLKHLKTYLKGSLFPIILSFFSAAISVAAKLAVPFLTGKVIDAIPSAFTSGDYSPILSLLLWMLLFILAGAIFRFLFDYSTAYIGQTLVKKMRDDVYNSLLEVPVSYLDSHYHGDLLLRLTNDIENVQTGLVTGVGALYEGIVQILVTIAFMFSLNWALGLTVVLLTPLSILMSRFISSHNAKYFKAQNQELGLITAFSLESISNLEAIQGYGLSEKQKGEFAKKNLATKKANFRATFAASWINPSTRLVNNTIYGSVILFGVYMLLAEPSWLGIPFSVGGLSAFLTYSYQYMTPFNEIADASGDVFNADASLGRIMDAVLADKDKDEGKVPLGKKVGDIEARHLSFGYDSSRLIIDDFDVKIFAGHKIALVGPTGCGKTTIINLLMRFYDADKGAFYFHDVSSLDIPKPELRSRIGMVLQDTWLSKASISDNIAFGKIDATREEIVAAAKKAHADDFIRQLSQGYDTIISNASGLSTGQKQLLCVARILLLQPEIVLLDEATSNIDLRTELALSEAFDELMKGKTSLVVAHRLSTIKNADLILVMKEGKIIEQGNFSELMKKEGFFAELYRAQFA